MVRIYIQGLNTEIDKIVEKLKENFNIVQPPNVSNNYGKIGVEDWMFCCECEGIKEEVQEEENKEN